MYIIRILLIALLLFHVSNSYSQVVTYSTPGTYTVTIPAGVSTFTIQAWGGGGSGGFKNDDARGGGGGGAYAVKSLTVSSATQIQIKVGAGGVINGATTVEPGEHGSSSTVTYNGITITANGGRGGGGGGKGGNDGNDGGAGGIPTISAGSLDAGSISGGNGYARDGNKDLAGGGGGGSGPGSTGAATIPTIGATGGSPNGGNGGNGGQAGNPGVKPGGGGGGKGGKSSTVFSGNGADGQVIITFSCPTYSLTSTNSRAVCSGSASTITLSSTATSTLPVGTYTVTYNLSGTNTATAATAAMTVSSAGTGTFSTSNLTNAGSTVITVTNLQSGTCSNSVTQNNTSTIVVGGGNGTWLGTTSTNWNDASNWCGGVPTNITDVTIPAGLTNYPVITATATGTCRTIVDIAQGSISGTGTLTIVGNTGVAVSNISGSGIEISCPLILPSTSSITVGTGSLTISSRISGAGTALTKSGSGVLTLSGSNTYAGTTTISAGTLRLGADNALSSGAVNVNGGTWDVVGFSDAVGAVTLTDGAILGTTGIITGTSYAVQNGSISAVLAGSAVLTKTTTGTVTLLGINTYTGSTTVSAGTLKLGAAGVIANGSALSVASGATFDLSGFSETVGSIAGAGSITSSSAGTPVLTGGGDNSSTTFSGVIQNGSATSVSLTKSGSGILTLSGVNTYTGATTVSTGTLKLGQAGVIADGSALSVASGATFDLSGFSETVGSIAGAGSITSSLASTPVLTCGGDNSSTTFSGIIQNGSATSVSLTKSGSGILTLSGVNTYTGGTILNAGQLNINNASAIGTGTLTINGGSIDNTTGSAITLSTNNPQIWQSSFTFVGSRDLNLGTGSVSFDQNVTVTATSSTSTLTVGGIVSGNANNFTLTKSGAGRLRFGSNPVTMHGLTITAGTLVSTTQTLTINGDFTNNASFLHNDGTVLLGGGNGNTKDSHNIGSTASTPVTNIFKNLVLSTTTTKTSKTLTSPAEVLGQLTLIKGYLISTSSNTLTIANVGTVSGASDESFVSGPVTKVGNTFFEFPLGASYVYNNSDKDKLHRLALTPNSALSSTTSFTAEYVRANPNGINSKQPSVRRTNSATRPQFGGLQEVSEKEYWKLSTSSANPGTSTITLYWHETSGYIPGTYFDNAAPALTVARLYDAYSNTSTPTWENASTSTPTVLYNAQGPRSVTVSNFEFSNLSGVGGGIYNRMPAVNEGFSSESNQTYAVETTSTPEGEIFTFGDNAFKQGAMPVRLTNFTAKLTPEKKVALSWVTASESVNKGFHVERQASALSGKFEPIGFVNTKAQNGNSQANLYYNFTDPLPKVGATSFYRLVQEDLDGTRTNSEVRLVRLDGHSVILVYPNPSNGNVVINRTDEGKKMNIQVFDQAGRIVKEANNIVESSYKLTLSHPGIYNIKLIHPETGEQSIQRIVIHK